MKTGFNQIKPAAAAVFIIPLMVYIFTLAPSVWFIDSGELALAAAKLGISHPTGYPIFTIIGRLFVLIFPASAAYSLNLMCALFISLALLILFYCNFPAGLGKLKNESPISSAILSSVPVLILGFSITVWDFATSLEVYSLQMMFFSLLIFLLVKIIGAEKNIGKIFLVFSFVLGLSFTNHLSTIMLIPSVIYAFIAYRGKISYSIKNILSAIFLFITGLSVYIYLPVRNSSVLFNWGDPGSFQNLFDHISGEQYIRFRESTGILNSLTKFAEKIPVEFTYPILIIIFAGIIYLFITDTKLFTVFFLAIFTNIIVASLYKIPDISNYYLLSFITLSIFFSYGLSYLYILIKPYFKQSAYVLPLLVLIPLLTNYSRSDKSVINILGTYNANLFNSMEQNAILLTGKWDYIAAPALYFQYVNNQRPDITVLDIKLMKTSWYIKYLIKARPDLYSSSKLFFDTHLNEALKFESDKDGYLNPKTQNDIINANNYRASYLNLLKIIIETNTDRFYSTYDIPADSSMWILKDFKKIPTGILLQYSKNDTLIEFDDIKNINYSLPSYDSPYVKAIKDNYLVSLVNKSKYMVKYQKNDMAKILLNKALEIDPAYAIAKDLLRKLE